MTGHKINLFDSHARLNCIYFKDICDELVGLVLFVMITDRKCVTLIVHCKPYKILSKPVSQSQLQMVD